MPVELEIVGPEERTVVVEAGIAVVPNDVVDTRSSDERAPGGGVRDGFVTVEPDDGNDDDDDANDVVVAPGRSGAVSMDNGTRGSAIESELADVDVDVDVDVDDDDDDDAEEEEESERGCSVDGKCTNDDETGSGSGTGD